jgi:hypothetical protein
MIQRSGHLPVNNPDTRIPDLSQQQVPLQNGDTSCQGYGRLRSCSICGERNMIRAYYQELVTACSQPNEHRQVILAQRADKDELRPGGKKPRWEGVQISKDHTLPGPGPGQCPQDALSLSFAVTGHRPIPEPPIDQQTYPVAIFEEGIRQRGGGVDGVLKEHSLVNPDIGTLPSVKDEAHIGDKFLLKLVGKKGWNMAGACAPVDPPPGIAPLILSYPKELDARPTLPGGDRAGVG